MIKRLGPSSSPFPSSSSKLYLEGGSRSGRTQKFWGFGMQQARTGVQLPAASLLDQEGVGLAWVLLPADPPPGANLRPYPGKPGLSRLLGNFLGSAHSAPSPPFQLLGSLVSPSAETEQPLASSRELTTTPPHHHHFNRQPGTPHPPRLPFIARPLSSTARGNDLDTIFSQVGREPV